MLVEDEMTTAKEEVNDLILNASNAQFLPFMIKQEFLLKRKVVPYFKYRW